MVNGSIPYRKLPCNRCQKMPPCICVFPGTSQHLLCPADFNARIPKYLNSMNQTFLLQNVVQSMDAGLIPYHGIKVITLPHPSTVLSPPPPPPPPASLLAPPSKNSSTTNRPYRLVKKFQCNACGKSFDYKHVLQNHIRTHTGEKPFGCTVCGHRFTRDHHLKTHTRLHTGEKPYSCDRCDAKFVQVANLRRHFKTHVPIKCEFCNESFPNLARLKSHLLEHNLSPANPAQVCHICNENHRPEETCTMEMNELRISGTKDMDADNDVVCSEDSRTSGSSDQHVGCENSEAIVLEVQVLDLRRVVENAAQSEPEDLSMKKY